MTTVEEVQRKYEATIVEMRAECKKMVMELEKKYKEALEKQAAEQAVKHEEAMKRHEAAMKEIMVKYEQVIKDSEGVYGAKGKGRGGKKDDEWDDEEKKKTKRKKVLVDSKAFGNLKKNKGRYEDFLDWKFDFKMFLDSADKNYKDVLKEVEKLKVDEIDDDWVEDYVRKRAEKDKVFKEVA